MARPSPIIIYRRFLPKWESWSAANARAPGKNMIFAAKIIGGILAALLGGVLLSHPDAQGIVSAAKPSVGFIVAERPSGTYSGMAFVAGKQLVLTAHHVVAGASRIRLKFLDSPWVEPKVVETNVYNDLAVLAIPELGIRPLPLGDIGTVQENDRLVVIAFPDIEKIEEASQIATEATVSAVRNGTLLIRTSQKLGGNGGLALNLRGEVIGLIRGPLPGEEPEINFATPASAAKPLLSAAVLKSKSVSASATPPPPVELAPTQASPASVLPQPTPAPAPTPPAQPLPPSVVASPPPSVVASPPPPAATAADPFLILPSQGIGRVRLGMQVQDVAAVLGPRKSTSELQDGSAVYRWYEPPTNDGLGVQAMGPGGVYRIWALNDDKYVTKERLHAGSSEAEVRAALGEPSGVAVDAQAKRKMLIYESLGLWFVIQLDEQYKFYNAVFEIGVMLRK